MHYGTLVMCRSQKHKEEVEQLECGAMGGEHRERTTMENGALLNGHRPLVGERAEGNTERIGLPENEGEPELPENEGQPELPENEGEPELPENEGEPELPENGGACAAVTEQDQRHRIPCNLQQTPTGAALLGEHSDSHSLQPTRGDGEASDGGGGATTSTATVPAEGQRDMAHKDTGPQQTKASGRKTKPRQPPPINTGTAQPPGETYSSGTLPSETLHASGKTAVSPKSATFPKTSTSSLPSNTELQSFTPRVKKSKAAPPVDHRFSDHVKPKPAAKYQLAKRPYSAETSVMTQGLGVRRMSKDYQETTPGDHSPRVQGGYYNSLKHRESLT